MNVQAFFRQLAAHVFRVDSYVCVLALVMLLLVGGLLAGPSTRKAKASTLAGSVWAPLGFGLDNFVTAIAVNGNDVYAAGTFIKNICGNPACDSGNVPINRIAKWDGTQWSPLGFGLMGVPTSIVINQGKVYVTGAQKICGDPACSTGTVPGAAVAVWDGGSWSAPFPTLTSFSSCCGSIEFVGSDIYGGGNYVVGQDGEGKTFRNWFGITILRGGSWVPPPNNGLLLEQGPPGFDEGHTKVASLFAMGNDLYAGGFFDQSGTVSDQNGNVIADPVKNLRLIAVLRGDATWQPLPGQGLKSPGCFNAGPTNTCGDVSAFAAIGTDLYVGGGFNQTFDGSLTLNNIAKFDTVTRTWSALPNNGLNSSVGNGIAIPGGLATRGNDLFAIGAFTATADNAVTGLNGIAWLHNGTWSGLGNGFVGGGLEAIAVTDDNIYVGGKFSENGDGTAPGMNNIARLVPVITSQLDMTKTVDANQVNVGQNLTYTITVKNKGPQTAQAVTLSDPLASNVTFSSVTGTQGNCSQSKGVVTCNIGDLANAGIATVTIVVTANAPGDIVNNATVSGANSETVQASAKSTALAGPTIQFSASSYSVGEGDGRANISVVRTGDSTGAVSVDYATSDAAGAQACSVTNGLASSRCDYITTVGRLSFAGGETSKTISVPIIDDSYVEGSETFNISLSNPLDTALGAVTSATITIIDNDTSATPNPIDQASFFVRQHYLDFLNREPDASGLSFWSSQITSCGADASCIDNKRVNVSAAFFVSIEFQQTGYLVERIYKTAFGDANTVLNGQTVKVPIVRLNEFLPDTQQTGQGVVVGQAGWDTLLESNKQAFTLSFVQRSRFTTAFPTTMTPAQFVDQLFSNAGVTPTTTERNAAIAEFGSATTSADVTARSRALRDVAESATLNSQEFNRAFVLMQYMGYLRRNPNDSPDSDYAGYQFWLNKLNAFGGDYLKSEMVRSFIVSSEYRQRFGP
jgi:uncharacterized repeat protein (TIGR01451 family)